MNSTEKNGMGKKYIITSGCSFTRQEKRLGFNGTDSDFLTDEDKYWRWPHHIQTKYPNDVVYNLGNPTNDNYVISQLCIKKITELLQDGVSPSDIKVIIQWSEQNRNSFFISNSISENYGYFVKDADEVDDNKWAHLLSFESNYFDEKLGYYLLTGGYGVDHIYYPKDLINIHGKYVSNQESCIRFFTNIILIQNFCKVNNIDDLLMFNLSYNFIIDDEPGYYDNMEQVYLKKELPRFTSNFKSDNPYISYLYKNIDFEKFWFYRNEYTNVGGQLEWAISEFDYKIDKRLFMEHNYINSDLESFCKISPEFGGCTGHVSSEMNKKFVDGVLDKFLNK